MKTYLDTHVAVWLYYGRVEELSSTAVAAIEEGGALLLSPVVLLEFQYLLEVGKISDGPGKITSALARDISLCISRLSFREVMETAVGEVWTRDPFDRVIVAQARADGCRLLTRDRKIRENYRHSLW